MSRAPSESPRGARGVLEPREHTAFDGTPYFDEDLQVAQSHAHRVMVVELSSIFDTLAEEASLSHLSDQPIWYLHPETDEQRVFYGDLVLGRGGSVNRITAAEVLLVAEVVTTTDRRKELKDTRFQRLLNEYNEVPEFVLVFPELEDARALTWLRLRDGVYEEQVCAPESAIESQSVPGLELRVRPRSRWQPGRKIDVWFRGELRPPLAGERARAAEERARAAEERARADEERARADEERARADEARARADRLAERLRQAGIDPDREP